MGEFSQIREPAWVTSKADQLLADLKARTTPTMLAGFDVVMMPLREPPEGVDTDRWERCCDNCETYVPPEQTFNTGLIAREAHGKRVFFGYGACLTCLPTP